MLMVSNINFNQKFKQNKSVSFGRRGSMPNPPEIKKAYKDTISEVIHKSIPIDLEAFIAAGFPLKHAKDVVRQMKKQGYSLQESLYAAKELEALCSPKKS